MDKHPAHQFDFQELHKRLLADEAAGRVTRTPGPEGLEIFCYSRSTVLDRAWTPTTLAARGLILDPSQKRIVATPFPKFFNWNERPEDKIEPSAAFEAYEKLDGSLIIMFRHRGRWQAATKSNFASQQAQWAQAWLDEHARDGSFDADATYLAEFIGPANQIVIRYDQPELVLLGAYWNGSGDEMRREAVEDAARRARLRCVARIEADSLVALMERASSLPATQEGFVLRFDDGKRVKLKGNEYRRIHAILSDLTPLGIWRVMEAGGDLVALRRDVPEEFWDDLDHIAAALGHRIDDIASRTQALCATLAGLSDKEVAARLQEFPEDIRRFVFPCRKNGGDLMTGRGRAALFREIRPTGNQLEGYAPSYAVNRLADESL